MTDTKSTTIAPIAVYCFILGICFLAIAVNIIMRNSEVFSGAHLMLWLAVIASTILAVGCMIISIGIFNLNRLCWKILFFTLAISVSSISALVMMCVGFLVTSLHVLAPYYQIIQKTPGGFLVFLAFFVSEIIVLFYLASNDVVSCFGEMGPMIDPF